MMPSRGDILASAKGVTDFRTLLPFRPSRLRVSLTPAHVYPWKVMSILLPRRVYDMLLILPAHLYKEVPPSLVCVVDQLPQDVVRDRQSPMLWLEHSRRRGPLEIQSAGK